jgi:hypothetical protein
MRWREPFQILIVQQDMTKIILFFFALTQSVSLANFAVQDEYVEECDSRQLDAIFLANQNLKEAEAVLGYADGIVIQGHIKFR